VIRLLWLDYLATLRERKTWLCVAMLAYAVVAIPVVLARPPEHVRAAITTWFGGAAPFQIFMFVWVDLAMNKAIAFLPVVLASGVVLRERDTGVLPLLASKPLSIPRYFALRALSACAVMVTLHVATQLAGAVYFGARVPGFRPGPFLGAMSLHAFAALFATALCAAIAAWVKHRGASALLGFGTLGGLVGLSLIGYYQPAWRGLTLANPIALGALGLGSLDHLGPAVLVPPMLALAALTALAIAAGAAGVRRMEA
jgi:ABC-2 type transport system permease protein